MSSHNNVRDQNSFFPLLIHQMLPPTIPNVEVTAIAKCNTIVDDKPSFVDSKHEFDSQNACSKKPNAAENCFGPFLASSGDVAEASRARKAVVRAVSELVSCTASRSSECE